MSKDVGRETMLNASPMSKTGLVLAQGCDVTSPDTSFSRRLSFSSSEKHIFQVGDRCYVGGNRPGIVAYIGETHFAPGEWVGIILDDPSGKNDGCVSGKRYFQCEPKRGVFSRSNRLTISPLPIDRTPSEIDFSDEKFRRSVSPSPSTSSAIIRTSRLRELQIGDRVIVSSGLGSRPGELKFIGETQFAAGNWCGIQLDEPNGKNNGSVDGVKYFECPEKFGIFVPIAKVSLSPLARKSNLSRSGSRESLASCTTLNSVATTNTSRLRMSRLKKPTTSSLAMSSQNFNYKTPTKSSFSMQDLLREKQQYIEQLMIERDLDREDSQNQILILQKNISDLNDQNNILNLKLNESEGKCVEMKNALDEVTFCGDELNIQNQEFREKIDILQKKLAENGIPYEVILQTSTPNTCTKCQELLIKNELLNNEVSTLKRKVETSESLNQSNNNENSSDIIAKEDEVYKKELKISELEELIITLKHEKEMLDIDFHDAKMQIESKEAKVFEQKNNFEIKLHELQIENSKIKDEHTAFAELKIILENKILVLEEELENKKIEVENTLKDRDVISQQFTELQFDANKKESVIKTKETQLKDVEEKYLILMTSFNELENQKNFFEREMNLSKQANINIMEKENKLNSNLTLLRDEKDNYLKKYEEYSSKNDELNKTIANLNLMLNEKNVECNKIKKLQEDVEKANENLVLENIKCREEMNLKSNNLSNYSDDISNLKKEVEKLKQENEKLINICNTNQNLFSKKLASKEREVADLESELIKLKSQNQELETKNIESKQKEEYFQEQINLYENKLKNLTSELATNIESKQSCTNELKTITEQFQIMKRELAQKELLLQENKNYLSKLELEVDQNQQLNKEQKETIVQMKHKQHETETNSTKQFNEYKFLNENLETTSKSLNIKIKELENDIFNKNNEIEVFRNQLKFLESELTSSIKNKEHEDTEMNQLLMALEIVKNDVNQKEAQIKERDTKISKLEQIVVLLKDDKQKMEESIHKLNENIEAEHNLSTQKQIEIASLLNQIKQLQDKSEEAFSSSKEVENNLNESKKMLVDLKNENESLELKVKSFESKIKEINSINKEKDEDISKKENDLIERFKKIQKLEKENSEFNNTVTEVQINVQKLTETLNSKSLELEDFRESTRKLLEDKENLIKEKLNEIENLKIQLKNVTESNISLSENFEKSKNNEITLLNQLVNEQKNIKLIEKQLTDLDHNNKSDLSNLQETEAELKLLKEIIDKNVVTIEEKNHIIDSLNTEIQDLKKSKYSVENSLKDTQEQLIIFKTNKEQEICDINNKLSNSEKSNKCLETDVENYRKQLDKNITELDNLIKSKEEIQNEFKKSLNQFEEELLNSSNKIKILEQNITKLKEENVNSSEEKRKLEEKLLLVNTNKSGVESVVNDLKKELIKEKSNYDILNQKYEKLILDLSTLENAYKTLKDLEQKALDLQHINDMLLEENNKLKQDISNILQEKQDAINNAELLEFENDKEIEKLKLVTTKLKDEIKYLQKQLNLKDIHLGEMKKLNETTNRKVPENAIDCETQMMKKSVTEDERSISHFSNNSILDSDVNGQINFLNSIIADMHKKNETLKARIDVLEMNPGDISKHFNMDILTKRKPAPRLFCDICDEFDQHDTEDCPLQSSDSPPLGYNNNRDCIKETDGEQKKTKPPPREYCENCEVFGHDTKLCSNGEYF